MLLKCRDTLSMRKRSIISRLMTCCKEKGRQMVNTSPVPHMDGHWALQKVLETLVAARFS